jgi:hypothetical protein
MHRQIVHRRVWALLTPALLLAVASCASGSGTARDPFSGAPSRGDRDSRAIRVEVENTNFNQATVEARGVGTQRRLGRVSGNSSDRFTLDWGVSGPLYFYIDLLGSGGCTTRALDVSAGDTVRVIIESMPRIRADGVSRICDVMRAR